MIEGVQAVAGVEAVSIAAFAASTRRSIDRRQRRLRWLASLARAQGDPDPDADRRRDAALLEDNRERIAAALETIEQLARLGGDAHADDEGTDGGGLMAAADCARRIAEQGAASLRIQARLGAAGVRRLIAPENEVNGINRL